MIQIQINIVLYYIIQN